jgi:hypothetical protein
MYIFRRIWADHRLTPGAVSIVNYKTIMTEPKAKKLENAIK